MSSTIIHSITVEKDRLDDSVFIEKTTYSSSNVWNYDNKSRPRHDHIQKFSDTEKGNLAMYQNSQSAAYDFSAGCSRGFGLSGDLSAMQVFRRNANRANRAGMQVPLIVDPKKLLWCRSSGEAPFPSIDTSRIQRALREKAAASIMPDPGSIPLPERFEYGYELSDWALKHRLDRFTLDALEISTGRRVSLRFFIRDRVAYVFNRRSTTRGTFFSGRDYKILGLAKITRLAPTPRRSD